MYIERVQIEEGFLNGLDISPLPGLAVMIGARGTGKTSLVELIRFCLNVPGYTPETQRRSRDHALSVLGSGQITITLIDQGRRITVTRSAAEDAPRASGPYAAPIILSQTEIETVGLQPGGRLRLLDGFLGDQRTIQATEADAAASVRSLTAEANAMRVDLDQLSRQLGELPSIDQQIAALGPQEQQLATVSAEAQQRQGQLSVLAGTISVRSVAASAAERFLAGIARWRAGLRQGQGAMPIPEPWPAGAGADPLGALRTRLATALQHLDYGIAEIEQVEVEAANLVRSIGADRIGIEEQARQLRTAIEGLQSGAGEIMRRGQVLRERKAQLESLRTVHAARHRALAQAIARRSAALDGLEDARTQRFHQRQAAAEQLNRTLGPRIRIDVVRGGQTEAFAAAIADALRGSGLRYNDFVAALVKRMSPRDLLEAIESDNYPLIAASGGVTADRAAKAVLALKEADLGGLATLAVDDFVSFSLLDGSDHKDIADLSTGQRCTVILPIVLRHTDRLLIVDQPEDHIDNGFIVDTLIQAILARSTGGQIIFSTHNANIPVLGNADYVLQLGSDGRRGFPLAAAPLAAPPVVNAITSIMEGGAEAFARRARFYGAAGAA